MGNGVPKGVVALGCARGREDPLGVGLGAGLVVDAAPVDDRARRAGSAPLDKGHGDGAMTAAGDGLQDTRVGDGVGVAFALETELLRIDAARGVDAQDEQEVHGLSRSPG